ncbi:hypothetical protein NC651_005854 [Populus alba x Populus x berolinensis]|nr:hypothetical protein NC651_005854 [Populus alba x Populus x berolinensis]
MLQGKKFLLNGGSFEPKRRFFLQRRCSLQIKVFVILKFRVYDSFINSFQMFVERDLARDPWRAPMKYNCGLTRSIGIWTMRSLAFVANACQEDESLSEKKTVKVAQEIESEAKYEKDFLETLQMTVMKAQAGVKNNLRKLNKGIIKNGGNHIVHVVVFALFCFLVFYLWSKMSRR